MQTHHMIDPEHSGKLQVIPNVRDRVVIMTQPHSFGMHWRETPVLTRRKNQVRWRASRGTERELIAVAPNVIAVGMKAERQVEIQEFAGAPCAVGHGLKLFVNLELRVEVVSRHALVILGGFNFILKLLRPFGPTVAEFFGYRTKPGVQIEFR